MPWKLLKPLFSPLGLLAAVLLLRSDKGKKALRGAAKEAVKAGYVLKEESGRLLDEAKEQLSGLVQEARSERNGHETEQISTSKG